MKLAALYFDDTVVIPGAKDLGAGTPRQDLRESTFHASEGWQLDEVEDDVFRIWREGMPSACIVGGYGYTYVIAVDQVDPTGLVIPPRSSEAASTCGEAVGEQPCQGKDAGSNPVAATDQEGPSEATFIPAPAGASEAGTTIGAHVTLETGEMPAATRVELAKTPKRRRK